MAQDFHVLHKLRFPPEIKACGSLQLRFVRFSEQAPPRVDKVWMSENDRHARMRCRGANFSHLNPASNGIASLYFSSSHSIRGLSKEQLHLYFGSFLVSFWFVLSFLSSGQTPITETYFKVHISSVQALEILIYAEEKCLNS